MKLVASSQFEKKYKRVLLRNPGIKNRIDKTLRLLEQDMFHPLLETHKLSGKLVGLWACSCGKDCRIIFKVEPSNISEDNILLLLNFGTHDEVY